MHCCIPSIPKFEHLFDYSYSWCRDIQGGGAQDILDVQQLPKGKEGLDLFIVKSIFIFIKERIKIPKSLSKNRISMAANSMTFITYLH